MTGLRSWESRRWLAVLGAGGLVALATGVPTGIVRTPFYHRMTPVLWWNYPVWILTATLCGLIAATYIRSSSSAPHPARVGLAGGVVSALAVGCPICNKLVVLAVGVTGALNLWAPLQPILGLMSLAALGWALRQRLRGEAACRVPA